MIHTRRAVVASGAAALLSACAQVPSTRSYSGPEVTRVVVQKEKRRLLLVHGRKELRRYRIDLGFQPRGHKRFEGDGRTPEGRYVIDRQNPESQYHLSLGISYPNARDIAYARAHGRSPGGDIFVHGHPHEPVKGPDWTWGCIAVTNREIEEIFAMVRLGTPIDILA